MIRASILGMGQLSAAGAGCDGLRATLAGGAAPTPQLLPGPPDSDTLVPMLRADPAAARALVAPAVARRLDDFSLCALGAALLAVRDAGPDAEVELTRARTGIVVATGYGALGSTFAFLHDVVTKGDGLGSPIHFAQSVHNAPAFVISSALHVTGPTFTLTGFSLAWPRALAAAMGQLSARRLDRVLVCSADEHHPVLAHALAQLVQGGPHPAMTPLTLERASAVAGSTFTALLLGPADEPMARWGTIDAPTWLASPDACTPSATPTLLAAQGDRAVAGRYLALAHRRSVLTSYAAHWGANPTADAMSALAAALVLRDRTLYPCPTPEPRPTQAPASGALRAEQRTIDCAVVSPTGRGALVTLRRP